MSTSHVDISKEIWDSKYRYKMEDGTPIDQSIEDTWRRVAYAVAMPERDHRYWEDKFFSILTDFKFLPAGRIVSNAGTSRKKVTMFNCYVMNSIDDSMEGIFDAVREAALTQKQGGGVGFDFSTIRPRGAFIRGVESNASGPISFMQVFDATCRTVMSAGQRRGAQMAVLSISHPDVESFITAKREGAQLQMFNLSVSVPEAFMQAVKEDANWELAFDGRVYKTVRARDLFDTIMRSTYEASEPGVIFIDRVNCLNNLWYCETIRATNPCGEQPLPPYGACLLGSVNLTRFVKNPFSDRAEVDFDGLRELVPVAVRLLDNVIEISNFPLERQLEEATNKRRIGLGITGLADLFVFMGVRYGSAESLDLAEKIMSTIRDSAYAASVELAREKGAFPLFDAENYLKGGFVSSLPDDIRAGIGKYGIRNSHLVSIAPTGTISMFAGNVSSGLEPVFALSFTRRIRKGDGDEYEERKVTDFAFRLYREMFPDKTSVPDVFVTTDQIAPKQHVDIQARLQAFVDSSISKTINIPRDFPFDEFRDIYLYAYERGAKGLTTFRPSDAIAGILQRDEDKEHQPAHADEHNEAALPDELDIVPRRPVQLTGTTYKIKTPLSAQALYITINDITENGVRRPFEIFINSKNLQHFSWIVAITRLISAVFRRTSDPTFLVEELKSIFDPNGGYFRNGRYVPSLVAEIGDVIQQHLVNIGFMEPPKQKAPQPAGVAVHVAGGTEPKGSTESMGIEKGPAVNNSPFMICPQCGERALYHEENCNKCFSCGYSKCS